MKRADYNAGAMVMVAIKALHEQFEEHGEEHGEEESVPE